MKAPTIDQVADAYKRMGYVFFDRGDLNLNIFGVRSNDFVANTYNDIIGAQYKLDGKWFLEFWRATTDPGTHYLQNPLNKNGTLILLPGQYRGVYKIGVHGRTSNKPYVALEQVGPMRYVRDGNLDNILDFDLMEEEDNVFSSSTVKTNLHHDGRSIFVNNVARASAGCQVIATQKNHKRLMALCQASMRAYGNSFTYTLFTENQFYP